jgi:hypothetical protein
MKSCNQSTDGWAAGGDFASVVIVAAFQFTNVSMRQSQAQGAAHV